MRKFNITVNGNTYEVDVEEIGGVQTSAPVAPVVQSAPVAAPVAAPAPKPAPAPAAAPAGATKVVAPMPGTVVSVKVNVGDKVTKDTVVAILEAMKMENDIYAGADGTVAGISAPAGTSVYTGDVIVSLN